MWIVGFPENYNVSILKGGGDVKSDLLVFTVALNGYQWLYKNCIASHQRYADKHNYCYQAVKRPFFTMLGSECCWLKLSLALQAFDAGYNKVMFVDADAYINDDAPNIETTIRPDKHVYLAKSYSGRFNSGVIFMLSNEETIAWLNKILSARMKVVSMEDSVGWGENGHIIKHSKDCDFVETIDRRWNNTYDQNLDDYIRHFCFGPLRQDFILGLCHKIISRSTRLVVKLKSIANKYIAFSNTEDELKVLTDLIVDKYPKFKP